MVRVFIKTFMQHEVRSKNSQVTKAAPLPQPWRPKHETMWPPHLPASTAHNTYAKRASSAASSTDCVSFSLRRFILISRWHQLSFVPSFSVSIFWQCLVAHPSPFARADALRCKSSIVRNCRLFLPPIWWFWFWVLRRFSQTADQSSSANTHSRASNGSCVWCYSPS